MTIDIADLKIFKSATVSDGAANGGRAGITEIITGIRHALFPRVTQEQRTAGLTRYRKAFTANFDAGNAIAYDARDFIMFPSIGGDRFYLGVGTQLDTQADVIASPPDWVGCGQLNAPLVGGETSVDLLMPNNDYVFLADGYLFLSNGYKTGQTIASGVAVGDSVENVAGTWQLVAASNDIVFPYGIYLGNNTVLSYESGVASTEYLQIASASPYSYVGNVATVQLQTPVVGAYATANTYGAQCLSTAEIKPDFDSFLTSPAGIYDESTYPPELTNKGTVEDQITIVMTSGTNFNCTGLYEGSLGTGSISADFSPINPATGAALFTLRAAGWMGTPISGDNITFSIHPAKLARWFKEVVPAATPAENDNIFVYSGRVE